MLIIGILASVAVPQYTKAVEKSRAAGVIQKVKSLQNAVDMYLLANDWPTVQFTHLSSISGRENLDISFKANSTMKRSGLAESYYMVFDDYYFYVVCERDVCYIVAEDNKPYKEQIVRASWYRYKNYTRYQPMDTWNRGTDTYKHSSKHFYYCHYNPIERLAISIYENSLRALLIAFSFSEAYSSLCPITFSISLFKLSLSMFFNKIQLPPTST